VSPALARDPLKQDLDAAAVNAVAPHDKPDQRIIDEFGQRPFCDIAVHSDSPDRPRLD
jgi:hypothetical protein